VKRPSLILPAAVLLLAACGSGKARPAAVHSAVTPAPTGRAAILATAIPIGSAPAGATAPPPPPSAAPAGSSPAPSTRPVAPAASPPPPPAPAASGAPAVATVTGPIATQDPSASPEETLATLQKKAPVQANDPLVQQFAQQLDALSKKCSALSRAEIATEAYTINQGIVSSGVNESILDTLTGINKAIPANNQDACPKQFAAYASKRVHTP
jgi:hypothetical protein